jgi:hypothetical protein
MALQFFYLKVAEGAELILLLDLTVLESLPLMQNYLRRVRTS